ncbi:Hypothetical Protein FCC1311_056622 [Hondaea fermentalgiana]|uniref:Uncharacterized protein n=1 Tax=Hondaea fermentalgiana TaxID=2315210 RepID=A0A2R5GMB7_9STRA|nr:Hypothetical Protein FCC1311_056622 [Hondaea fermentalgiana]|eukprot:GBG29441.1 Hypothetical Protein FCC1311_056622 [Hondaea fermentalgiana]
MCMRAQPAAECVPCRAVPCRVESFRLVSSRLVSSRLVSCLVSCLVSWSSLLRNACHASWKPESESQAQSPIGQFAGLEALSEVATNEKARSDASSPTGAPSLPVKKPAFTPEKMTAMLAAVLANAAKGSPTASVPNLANMLSVMDGERKAASHINFANLLANSANNKKNTNDHDNNNDGGGNGGKKSPSTQLPATLSNAAAVAAAAASSNNQAPLLSAQSPMFCFGTVASTPKFAGPALHAPDSAAREPQDDLYGATQELEEEEDPVKVEADGARDESQRLPETMTKTKKNQAVEPADDDRNYDRNLLKMVLPPPTQYEQEVYYAYAKYRRMHLVVRAANNNVQFPPDKIAIRMRGKVRVRQGEGVDNYGRATYKDGQLDSVVTWSRTDQRNYVGAANNRHGLIKLRASKVDVRDDLVILDISILPQNVALFDAHRRIANRFTVEVICTYGKIKAIVKAPDLRVFAKQHGKKRMQDLPKEFSDRYEDYRQRVDRMRRGDHSAAHMIGASFASSPTSSPMFKLPHLPSLVGRPMDGPSATASAVAAAASPDQLASIIATLTKHQQQQQQFSMMQQRQHQHHQHQHHQHHQP